MIVYKYGVVDLKASFTCLQAGKIIAQGIVQNAEEVKKLCRRTERLTQRTSVLNSLLYRYMLNGTLNRDAEDCESRAVELDQTLLLCYDRELLVQRVLELEQKHKLSRKDAYERIVDIVRTQCPENVSRMPTREHLYRLVRQKGHGEPGD